MSTWVTVGRSLVAFAWFLMPTQAFSQHMNAPGVPCNKPSSTAEEVSCFQRSLETADNELNRVYTRTRSALSSEQQRELNVAEQNWMKYRDSTCNAEYKLYGGGTGGPVTRLACLAAITQQRVDTLKTTYGWKIEKLAH
jgi:uncharacterized protein YecT (DUF1311 family)